MMRIGTGYIGTPSVKTTTQANEEVVPPKKEGWTFGYNFYKFSFVNDQECTVVINNNTDNPILLRAGQGFNSDEKDAQSTVLKLLSQEYLTTLLGRIRRCNSCPFS